MAIISLSDLPTIRKKHRNEKLVFASGSFDLAHAGHVLFFEDCKKYGDVLVMMIGSDAVLKRIKGEGRPILNEHLRVKMIDALKPIDYCFLDRLVPEEGTHQLACVDKAIRELKPDIYVINDDAFDIPYRETMARKHGVEMVILPRNAPPDFEGISTTKIIRKIKDL